MSDHQIIENGSTEYTEEPLLGTAQWMPPGQVTDRYIFEDGDLWLGRNGDQERTPIGRKDDSHVLLCAKTRSGKGRGLITNNLLLWPGSVFVNDPKGENASVTAARRGNGSDHATENLGQKVCVLDSHETATVDPEHRAYYNPIAEIRADDLDAESKAAIIAESCISSKEKPDSTWDDKAKTFFKTLILHIATDRFIPDEHRNLVTMRRFIVAGDFIAVEHIEAHAEPEQLKANPPDGFMLLLEGMKANTAFDGIISDQAKSLLESYARQPKMWNSIRTSAEEHSDWIDDNRIRSVLRAGEYTQTFTADELQSREGGISIYMCLPSSMKDYFASWPRIVVNLTLMAAQSRANKHPATGHQTLMMLDEFASMERMRRIETAAADIAGAGVKLFFVVQSLTQLKAVYGENWETFASSADTHIYYGFNDNFTAEYVSKRLGEVEIIRTTKSKSTAENTSTATADMSGGSSSTSQNTSTSWNRSNAASRGGGTGSSSGGSRGTTDSTGWGPSIFFRTLETTNQFARQSGRNYGTSRQENYNRTKTKGKTKTKGSSTSEGDNWSSTTTRTAGETKTQGSQQSIHKKPLAAINELMRLFGDIEDQNDPAYPGIGLISTASQDPMLIHKCHYDQDRFFEGLFDPHPKHGFTPLPKIEISSPEPPSGPARPPDGAFDDLPEIWASQTFQSYEARIFGLLKYHTGPSGENWDLALAPDERSFLVSSASGVFNWDVSTGKLIHPRTRGPSNWPGHSTSDTYGCDISSDGQFALTANASGEFFFWNYQTGEVLKSNSPMGIARKVKFALEDQKAISVSWDGPTVLWDLHSNSPAPAVALEDKNAPVGRTSGLVVSKDGKRAFIVGKGLRVQAWDLESQKLLWVTDGSYSRSTADATFASLAISSDEKLAIIGYRVGMMWVDLESGKIIQEAENTGYTDFFPVSGSAISRDGTKALTASNNDLLLWDISTRLPIKRLKGHSKHPTEIRFSRDGSFALSTSHDATVRLWRL